MRKNDPMIRASTAKKLLILALGKGRETVEIDSETLSEIELVDHYFARAVVEEESPEEDNEEDEEESEDEKEYRKLDFDAEDLRDEDDEFDDEDDEFDDEDDEDDEDDLRDDED